MYDERLAGGKVQSDLHGAAETHAGLMELWLVTRRDWLQRVIANEKG